MSAEGSHRTWIAWQRSYLQSHESVIRCVPDWVCPPKQTEFVHWSRLLLGDDRLRLSLFTKADCCLLGDDRLFWATDALSAAWKCGRLSVGLEWALPAAVDCRFPSGWQVVASACVGVCVWSFIHILLGFPYTLITLALLAFFITLFVIVVCIGRLWVDRDWSGRNS